MHNLQSRKGGNTEISFDFRSGLGHDDASSNIMFADENLNKVGNEIQIEERN